MAESLSCRGCRHELVSDAGCALCLPIKPHLVVTAAVDDDAVPLAVVATEAVSMLRKQLTVCKQKLKLTPQDADVAFEVRTIANTLAKVLDSARKVVQDGADSVGSMSFQEKANLFLEWTASLPGAYRRKLIDSMVNQTTQHRDPEPEDVVIN